MLFTSLLIVCPFPQMHQLSCHWYYWKLCPLIATEIENALTPPRLSATFTKVNNFVTLICFHGTQIHQKGANFYFKSSPSGILLIRPIPFLGVFQPALKSLLHVHRSLSTPRVLECKASATIWKIYII